MYYHSKICYWLGFFFKKSNYHWRQQNTKNDRVEFQIPNFTSSPVIIGFLNGTRLDAKSMKVLILYPLKKKAKV